MASNIDQIGFDSKFSELDKTAKEQQGFRVFY